MLAARLAAKYPGRVTGTLLLPGQAGDYAPIPDDVPEALKAAQAGDQERHNELVAQASKAARA